MDISRVIHNQYTQIASYLNDNRITAYHLLGENTDWPVVVDIYADNAVIHVFDSLSTEKIEVLQAALYDHLKVQDFFYKNRSKTELELPTSPTKIIEITEYGHRFKINLSDYLDTGIFLDHRETRRWLAGLCLNKAFLNTFAYTGSFSVYAAAAGARMTCSVDISRVYCDWARENLQMNQLVEENNLIYRMDTLDFFKYAEKKALSFDIIVIDPPTFSHNKHQSFSVQKDYPALINGALRILKQDGFILFSTNYRDFKLVSRELRPCCVLEKKDSLPPDYAGFSPHRCFLITPV